VLYINAFIFSIVLTEITRVLSTSQSNQKEVTVAPLVEQRKNRPIAPHLSIYQPQLTWYMSAFHRFTGGAVAVGKDSGLL
jgi:succinate dehydrogenase (ubiquinone) cytochrome b560 subunit